MKLKAVILDDSENDIRLLELELKSFPVNVEKRFTDPFKFIEEESKIKYDVLFLDMNMPGLMGSEIVSKVKKPVILITGESKNYAEVLNDLKLDNKHFVCTLNKPINGNRISKALELLKDKLRPQNHIHFNTTDGRKPIVISDIELISSQDLDKDNEGQGESKIVYLKGKSPLFVNSLNLDEVFSKLDSNQFIKANRFDIINISCIESQSHDCLKIKYTSKNVTIKESERTLSKEGKTQYKTIFR